MAGPTKINLIDKAWSDEMAETIAQETHKMVKNIAKSKKANSVLKKTLYTDFLSSYLEKIILECLNQYKEQDIKGSKAQMEYTYKEFGELKEFVRGSVSSAFERAFITYCNQYIPYYCLINPMPAPINKDLI